MCQSTMDVNASWNELKQIMGSSGRQFMGCIHWSAGHFCQFRGSAGTWWIGNSTGNPGVFWSNPYLYSSKSVSASTGTGYPYVGVWIIRGFVGFPTCAQVCLWKICIINFIKTILCIKKINHHRKQAGACLFLMVERWWWWQTSSGGDGASLISKISLW